MLIAFIGGVLVGFWALGKISNSFERYEIIEKAAKEGSQICRQYMNYKYGDWRM